MCQPPSFLSEKLIELPRTETGQSWHCCSGFRTLMFSVSHRTWGVLCLALYCGRQGLQLSQVWDKLKSCLPVKTVLWGANTPFLPPTSHLLPLLMAPWHDSCASNPWGNGKSQLVLSRLESAKARQACNLPGTDLHNWNNCSKHITPHPRLSPKATLEIKKHVPSPSPGKAGNQVGIYRLGTSYAARVLTWNLEVYNLCLSV